MSIVHTATVTFSLFISSLSLRSNQHSIIKSISILEQIELKFKSRGEVKETIILEWKLLRNACKMLMKLQALQISTLVERSLYRSPLRTVSSVFKSQSSVALFPEYYFFLRTNTQSYYLFKDFSV